MRSKKITLAKHLAQTASLKVLPRPAYFRAYRIAADTLVEPHVHDWCQFVFARRGIMHVRISDSTLIVPPQFGMWIPSNTRHSVWASGDVDLESLYIDTSEMLLSVSRCRVVVVSELVREFIHYACSRIGENYDQSGNDGRKVEVLLDLLGELPDAPLNLPMPIDEKLLRMCEQIHEDPSSPHVIGDWAKELYVSERTLARHFLRETGMTFHAWKQRLKLLRSLELLKDGNSVTKIALDLGYSSTSAYIYAFKALFGRSPKQFYRN